MFAKYQTSETGQHLKQEERWTAICKAVFNQGERFDILKYLMSCPEGNSSFCFPSLWSLNVSGPRWRRGKHFESKKKKLAGFPRDQLLSVLLNSTTKALEGATRESISAVNVDDIGDIGFAMLLDVMCP